MVIQLLCDDAPYDLRFYNWGYFDLFVTTSISHRQMQMSFERIIMVVTEDDVREERPWNVMYGT